LIAVAGIAFRFLGLSWQTLRFAFPLDYGEGAILDGALRLSRFQNLYPADLKPSQWFVSNYPPLFYAVHVPFIWIGGTALWQGRLISQIAAVVTACAIGLVVRDVMEDVAAAAIAALVFLTIPIVIVWAQYDRVDMLGLALSWWGIWSLTRRGGPHVGWAIVCFVASSYTRQTAAVPGIVSGYVWLRSTGRVKDANGFAFGVAAVGLTLFVVLDLVTRGGFFFHVVTGTLGAMNRQQLVSLGGELVALIPFLLLTAASVVLLRVWQPLPGWGLVVSYLAAAVAIALTVAKVGSYINYFLDLCAACSLAVGASISWLRPYRRLTAVFLLLLAVQIVRMAEPNALYDHLSARLKRAPEYGRLMTLVRAADGPVLADEPMALLPLLGRTIDFQPFAMTQLADARRWDDAPFIDRLNRQQFDLILLRMSAAHPGILRNLWDDRMASAIVSRYACQEKIRVDDGAFVAVYRPSRSHD
jgi:hypothetical protein